MSARTLYFGVFFPTDVLSIDKKFINNKSLTTVFILRGIPFMSKRTEILKASVSFGGQASGMFG